MEKMKEVAKGRRVECVKYPSTLLMTNICRGIWLTTFSGVSQSNYISLFTRVKCKRTSGLKFTMSGSYDFYQVLITNVALDGEVVAVKVKGITTGWIPMARNWGQNWHCNVNLQQQSLSYEMTIKSVNWQFRQTFEGKHF
ncbi:expansin-A16-like [Trifolium medium]|uniref:Expansin n=1 Tax=Trifolium medium TaxID=97028 RepID=A0A392M6A1_9FABA|nr:expansin-A16-like [Trifolium medium]